MVRTAKRRRAASSLLLHRLFEFPFANSGTLNLIVRTGGDSFIKTLINRPRPGIVCLPPAQFDDYIRARTDRTNHYN